ncbi:diacylglycerol kinase family protein [bacterium]|nr:diacylglycerol kinase family protein [bacterium]
MTKFKRQGFKNTFKNARKGMRLSIKSERNIRIHIGAGILAILLSIGFHFSTVKFCIVLLTISSVITSEMINSAIEFALDAMYHNRYSKIVGMAKDIAAGSVMMVTIIAILIGVLLFLPPLIDLFVN